MKLGDLIYILEQKRRIHGDIDIKMQSVNGERDIDLDDIRTYIDKAHYPYIGIIY